MRMSVSKRVPARSRSGPARGRAKPVAPQHEARASKVSVTVDAGVLREVKRLIRGTGSSLSAHVTQALESDLRRRRMQQLLSDYEAGSGTISEEELAEIQAEWRG
jgi:hypothetical protein